MKILLVAINAKYIHSNLAVYCLKSYAAKRGIEVELTEYTINHRRDDILMNIYQRKPDVVAFSCYIWNLEFVQDIAADLYKVLPDLEIWGGGPEVSYDAEKFLAKHPEFRGIMKGEGERTFCELAGLYQIYGKEAVNKLDECHGIVWRDPKGEISQGLPQAPISLDEVPFIYEEYENMMPFENRILYYETSRGCPFSCSYCLSSIDKRVRLRSMELVEKELQFFLDHKVPQVKFVDRTFNCNHRHSMAIWRYIKEHDNGITNFHFEIAADILNEEEMGLLATFRPGLAQLEIGVQSTNMQTIHEIDRMMDFDMVTQKVQRVASAENIHQHLDLIAGLPYEDYESFGRSFDRVYGMQPEQLQLGFLKVLKGSDMHVHAQEYGIRYLEQPPYEVLYTNWISYGEIRRLKRIEEMVELYYNSGQFTHTLPVLEKAYPGPFAMYEALADYYQEQGYFTNSPARAYRYQILLEFAAMKDPANREIYRELLTYDMYLRENLKSRPAFAAEITEEEKQDIRRFYQTEEHERHYLSAYDQYDWKQLSRMTHLELFRYPEPHYVLFDYQERNPLNYEAKVQVIGYPIL